nr:hypothetical protein [Tanacetum cinerariifolium]
MADVNAPTGQTPTMAPPVRADDQILSHIRALLTIINLCLTGKTSGFERPRVPVLQILWGIVTRTNIDYAERIWEEFTQSIHTFIEDKWNLARHTSGKKRATLIVIPSIRFTKLIIHHLQRKHRFHPRPDSPLHLSNEEPVLGYLKFSAKGTKSEAGSNPDETFEGHAGSNLDETSKGQARPDPGDAEAKNLKLTVEEPVLLEEPASSSGTLSSLQHLSRDFSFGDQFFIDKLSDANKNAKTEVESMVNVTIQQALSSISLMTSPIIDLTSRPESPKEHQQLKATTIDTTTTTTIKLPPPQAPQQSTTEAMMVKRIALETSMNCDHSEELAQDLAEARKKKKKSRESPKMPHGSPSHQPHPLPPPAGPSRASGAPRASESAQMPPSPPLPLSTNQESPSKGSAAPSPSKTVASAEYQAWTTTDIRLRPSISLTPADLEMDEDMAPDEQAQSSNDEDIGSAHIPMVNLKQGWWKPFEEERPTTPEPAWSIRSSDVPVPTNNWASALASNYSPPPEDSRRPVTLPHL